MENGYYQTKCTTTTVTSVPSSTTSLLTQGDTQTLQGADNCQYKWEGKGDNMR